MNKSKLSNEIKPVLVRILVANVLGFFILYLFRATNILGQLLFEQIIISALFIIVVITWFFLSRKSWGTNFVLEIFVSSLLFVNVASFGLVNIDRSRSFYVLSWIQESAVYRVDSNLDLNKVASKERLNLDAIQLRVDEQVSRGLVFLDGNKYQLTGLGKMYLSAANTAAKIYKLENWVKNQN